MMRVHISELLVGDQLSQDINNDAGILIFPSGTIIEEEHIQRLKSHFIDEVPITLRHIDDVNQYITTDTRITSRILPHFNEALDGFKHIYKLAESNDKIEETEIDSDLNLLLDSLFKERDIITLLIRLNSMDDYTFQHSVHVGIITYFISIWLGKDEDEAFRIAKAGYLHDIGKCRIPTEMLTRPGKLSNKEFEEIKKHPIYGYEIIRQISDDPLIATAVLQHHERMDGSGYPKGLKGDEIHEYARIISIADIYSAMVSSRAYQKKKDFLFVLKELHHLSFSRIDPKITQTFINHMIPNFIGKKLTLRSGESGTIVMNNPNDFFYPLIKIDDQFIDLSVHRDLEIEMIYI